MTTGICSSMARPMAAVHDGDMGVGQSFVIDELIKFGGVRNWQDLYRTRHQLSLFNDNITPLHF